MRQAVEHAERPAEEYQALVTVFRAEVHQPLPAERYEQPFEFLGLDRTTAPLMTGRRVALPARRAGR